MGIRLVAGAVFVVIGFLALTLCYLAARNPGKPWWAGDMLTGSVILPIAMGLLVLGSMLMGEALIWNYASLKAGDIFTSLGILVAGTVVYLMIGVKKRVAGYGSLKTSSKIMAS